MAHLSIAFTLYYEIGLQGDASMPISDQTPLCDTRSYPKKLSSLRDTMVLALADSQTRPCGGR